MSIRATIRTEADLETTWQRISDILRWPEWNPACALAETRSDTTEIVEGTVLRLQLRHPRGRLFWTEPKITAIEGPTKLEWVVRAMGVRSPLSITCDPLATGGTAVTLTTHSVGPMGFAYRLVFPEKAQGLLWSGTLTALAQSLRTDTPPPRRTASRRPPRLSGNADPTS